MIMDQNDVKACGVVNDDRNLQSPEQQGLLGKGTSLVDSCGLQSNANSGSEKKKHPSTSDHKTISYESSKFQEMDRKCLNNDCSSSADSAKVNTDDLKLSSAVVSPSRNSELKRDHCAERASSAVLHCDLPTRSASVKNFNVSTCSSRGTDSMQNFPTQSDVSSEGSKPVGKDSKEFIGGRMNEFWLGDNEDGLKSVMQVSGHNKRLKTESSYDSTNIAVSASSDDSCLEILLDVKSCEFRKQSYKNSSRFADFKGSLEASAVKKSVLPLGVGVQMGMKDDPFAVGSIQKRCPKQTVDSVGRRDCDKLLETAKDNNVMNVGADVIWKMDRHKKETEEMSKVKDCCEPDGTLMVARRVTKELEQEVGIYKEASEGCSWVQERSGESGQGTDDSAASDKAWSADTGSRNLLGNRQDNRDTVCSTKDKAYPEMPMRSDGLCLDVKELSQSTGSSKKDQPSENLNGRVLSPLATKPEDINVHDQFTGGSRFNLNDNILMDEVDDNRQLVTGSCPCNADAVSKPVPVVAKFGIPLCLLEPHLQLDEEATGWMGSSSTSAFRPTSFPEIIDYMKSSSTRGDSKRGPKTFQAIGFDLNIAAEGVDCDEEYLPEKYTEEKSINLSMEASSTSKERFSIDLNYAQEDDDSRHQPTSSSIKSSRDFDLNDKPTLADVCSDTQQPGKGVTVLGDKLFDDHAVKFSGNVSKTDSKSVGSSYWVDSSYMQSYSNGYAKPVMIDVPNILLPVEQMQNLVSMQQRSTYRAIPPPTPLPPRAFSYGNAFYIDPNNRLFSTMYTPGVIPYVTDPRAAPVFPHISTSGPIPAISGAAPHLMQIPVGAINSEMSMARPSFNVDGRVTSSNCGFQGENGRQWFVPANITRTESQMQSLHQQPTLTATSMKRKELEGVSDTYHLGLRPMTARP